MAEDTAKDRKIEPKPSRPTAQVALQKFMVENNMDLFVQKQKVRYMEDHGLVIEPPIVVVYYQDEINKVNKPTAVA